jgi:arabinan endo-1,5-alpha-L-arabinosidase
VKKVGDQDILRYSVSTGGSRHSAIGYATSSTMKFGTWVDRGSTGITTQEGDDRNAIDPTLFLDPASGKYYMSFGSYWTGIYVVPMNDAATRVASNAVYTNIAHQPYSNKAYEGANIIYHDAWYYVFISAGNSGSFDPNNLPSSGQEYKIRVCRSRAVTSPYVGPDGASCTDGGAGLVLPSHDNVYAPGGQGFFDDPTYGTVMYYHYGKQILRMNHSLSNSLYVHMYHTSIYANVNVSGNK